MLKRLWKRLKRFFSRIKDAVVELFTGELPEETANKEEPIKAEIVGEKKSEFRAWVKKIGGKMGSGIKKQIEDFAEHPTFGGLKIALTTGFMGIACGGASKIFRFFATPMGKALEQKEKACSIYDDRNHATWRTNRPLTPSERNNIMLTVRKNNWNMGEYLKWMGLLA
jgi:hypothetical protein